MYSLVFIARFIYLRTNGEKVNNKENQKYKKPRTTWKFDSYNRLKMLINALKEYWFTLWLVSHSGITNLHYEIHDEKRRTQTMDFSIQRFEFEPMRKLTWFYFYQKPFQMCENSLNFHFYSLFFTHKIRVKIWNLPITLLLSMISVIVLNLCTAFHTLDQNMEIVNDSFEFQLQNSHTTHV